MTLNEIDDRVIQSDFNGGFLACSFSVLDLIRDHGSLTTKLFEEVLMDEYPEIYQLILDIQRLPDVEWSYFDDPRDGEVDLFDMFLEKEDE